MWRDRLRRLSTSAVVTASAAAASGGGGGGGSATRAAAARALPLLLQSHRQPSASAWSRVAWNHSSSSTKPTFSSASAAAGGAGAGNTASAAATPPTIPTPKNPRRRLDEVCLELHPDLSRNQIQSWIAQGRVTVDGRPATKAGAPVPRNARVVVDAREERFVCRAGYKLERALDHFALDVRQRVCLDSGLSTGGFSDCLMQRGARRVYGVDVGYGQVAGKLRTSAPRLTILERTNLRHLKPEDLKPGCWAFEPAATGEAAGQEGGSGGGGGAAPAPPSPAPPPPVSLVTLDLSFISVLKVLPAVVGVLIAGRRELKRQQALLREAAVAEAKEEAKEEAATPAASAAEDATLPPPPPLSLRDALPQPAMVVLIKPQFEAGRRQVGSGGVVRDPAVHRAVIERVSNALARCGLSCRGVIESPLKGDKGGNTEFLGLFVAEREDEEDAGLSMAEAVAIAGGGGAEGEWAQEPEEGGGGGRESDGGAASASARRLPRGPEARGGGKARRAS